MRNVPRRVLHFQGARACQDLERVASLTASQEERGRQRQRGSGGAARRVEKKREHNRLRTRGRSSCKDCGGTSICQHNRRRSDCRNRDRDFEHQHFASESAMKASNGKMFDMCEGLRVELLHTGRTQA